MGRLTLNVLLSFAQFEREVTSERIRDKIAASKRKGLWVGGVVPLGYKAKDRKITIVESEATTVRHIFRRYLELGSINAVLQDLRKSGVTTKRRPYLPAKSSEASLRQRFACSPAPQPFLYRRGQIQERDSARRAETNP
jgi:DNA invertase Pin-like site-specific DNA recombinase